MRIYVGSIFYGRNARRRGWGRLFGGGFQRQGPSWEVWLAVFGRTFWLGRTKPSRTER